jgi:hypothetical protein
LELVYVELLKAGQMGRGNGVSRVITDADLRAAAAAYDPTKHEAPLVFRQPLQTDPAYGWVKSLRYEAGRLLAGFHQVNPQFAEHVQGQRYERIVPTFYAPNSVRNPVKGSFYLQNVCFKGIAPPPIKGLRLASSVEYSDHDDTSVTFSDGTAVGSALVESDINSREAALIMRTAKLINVPPPPAGWAHDPARVELHRHALAFQEVYPGTTYQTALNAASKLLQGGGMSGDTSIAAALGEGGERSALHAKAVAYQARHPGVDFIRAYKAVGGT